MTVEKFVVFLIIFSIVGLIIWAFYKKLSWDNISWRQAAERNKLQYKNLHYTPIFDGRSQLINLRDLSKFLPVVSDPTHVISVKHIISGGMNGHQITLIDAEAGFNFTRGFNLLPRRTAPFFFVGHISSPSITSLLLQSHKSLGEINLTPTHELTKQYETDTYTIFADSNNKELLSKLTALNERYSDQPAFDLAMANNSIYLFSPFRPDPEKWIELLSEVAEIKA